MLQRRPLVDPRGYLERMFCAQELKDLMGDRSIVQINHTLTAKAGTVRGMHFQYPPHAEIKFVSCIRGEVFDVAVDLRQGSSTFLQWHAEILTADNRRTLVIPEGFAHGFQTLTEDCEMLYFHTADYRREAEGAVNVADPGIDIAWPLDIAGLSDRDRRHPILDQNFRGIEL